VATVCFARSDDGTGTDVSVTASRRTERVDERSGQTILDDGLAAFVRALGPSRVSSVKR
jgi:hypothetical protein